MEWKAPTPAPPPAIPPPSNLSATCLPASPRAACCVTKAGAPPRWICLPSTPSRMPPSSRPLKSRSSSRFWNSMEPRYVIGIDLGTTNSALSYAEYKPDADPFALPKVELLGIPQLVNPSEVREEGLLPSFLYVPGATDFPAGATALPWDAQPDVVLGRLAQKRGAENAG